MKQFYGVDITGTVMNYPLYQQIKKTGINSNIKILDAGCGDGDALLSLVGENCGEGIDLNEKRINAANEKKVKFKFDKVNFNVGDCENIKFPTDYFDLTLSIEVLEFALNKEKIIEEMIRVTKPQGEIIIVVPNKYNPLRLVLPQLKQTDGFMSVRELKRLMKNKNVKINKKEYHYSKYLRKLMPKKIPFGTYIILKLKKEK